MWRRQRLWIAGRPIRKFAWQTVSARWSSISVSLSRSIRETSHHSSHSFDKPLSRFNVYVAQPEIKPGCILRRSNVNVLERRKLVSKETVETCKKSMNTFAFVGDLTDNPEISCVYHSEDAENQFLVDPKRAVMGDGYQAKP